MPIMVLCAVFYAPVDVFTNRTNAQIGCWCLPAARQVVGAAALKHKEFER